MTKTSSSVAPCGFTAPTTVAKTIDSPSGENDPFRRFVCVLLL